jgi:hypothetical protein
MRIIAWPASIPKLIAVPLCSPAAQIRIRGDPNFTPNDVLGRPHRTERLSRQQKQTRSRSRRRWLQRIGRSVELQFVGLAEASELTLLLADGEDARYERAALRWHVRFAYATKKVDIGESVAVLALLTAIPANRLAAATLAEPFSPRRSLERCAEALIQWARTA